MKLCALQAIRKIQSISYGIIENYILGYELQQHRLGKSSSYVISKVVMYGTIQDWYSICTFYGMDRIKNEMKKVRYLDDKSLAFLSIIFDEPKENFRCYTWKQSTPQHWTS